MRKISAPLSIAALLLVLAAVVFMSPSARSQIQTAPSFIPIGVSASGNGSTVWFHEPSSRQVLACHSNNTSPASVQCVASKLP